MNFSYAAKLLNCLLGVIQILHNLIKEAEHSGCVLHKPDNSDIMSS